MKTRIYIFMTLVISFFEIAHAQTPASTGDNVAHPTLYNSSTCAITSGAASAFPAPTNYNANSTAVQLGVNNTGTDICQIYSAETTTTPLFCQAMVWDKVTDVGNSPTNFTSGVYLSWKYENPSPALPTIGSFPFPFQSGSFGGFDPDVAIHSDATGTFIQVVFENVTTGSIDGYSFRWNAATSAFILNTSNKTTFRRESAKRAKNPNIAVPKKGNGIAVVWHEEGTGPSQTLSISYGTPPLVIYNNSVSILQSKVYIYCEDKTASTFLGSNTGVNFIPGKEVIPTNPSNQLFNRYFNPDVSFSEDRVYPSISNNLQRGISVVFVSEWFNPARFRIETGQLSVVQGTSNEFQSNGSTTTRIFTSNYVGKPRIAARLSKASTNFSKDFAVVMGNSNTNVLCGSATTESKLHMWWFQSENALLAPCPQGGSDLLSGTSYSSTVSINPVISSINFKGHYNVVFSSYINATNGFDIVANTYKEGQSITSPAQFSAVNYGTCSASRVGNQVVPSVASAISTTPPVSGDAHSNYLFWDQQSKTMNYKKTTNALAPGNGVSLRLAPTKVNKEFTAYPNPTDSEITFNYQLVENEKANEIEIFNMVGQSVDKFSILEDNSDQKRDVSKIPSGTYIAILKTNVTNYKLEFIKK